MSDAYPQVKQVIEKICEELPEELKPTKFEWTPDTYQVEIERKQVRKCEQYAKFHKFLVLMNEAGEISRQEIVSMIPAYLLDVQPGNSVLDVCAAPGSKTSQMVEMIGKNGCIVANDADKQRSYLLTHQTKRLATPNFVITNYMAQDLNFNGKQFDRMLCDVPCSGDGTVRKNIDARTKWHVMNGYVLHRDQLDIMKNVIKHVKVGGKFVYSTCSINPIEDEAVVAELLRLYKGTIRLVDARNKLPGLIHSDGLSTWKVLDKHFHVLTEKNDNIPQSAFPPTEEEAKEFHLEYTIRILPHKQNTGGFYSAIFEKIAETPVLEQKLSRNQMKKMLKNPEKAEEIKEKVPTKRKRGMAPIDDQELTPLFSHSIGEQVYKEIKDVFGLSESFPKEQLYVIGDECMSVNMISQEVAELTNSMKIVSGGIKTFKKQKNDSGSAYRIVSDGVAILDEYLGKERIIEITHERFLDLLSRDVPLTEFDKTFNGVGNYIVKITDGVLKGKSYCAWVGKINLSILISKQDLESLRFLFDISSVYDKKKETNDDADEQIEKVEKKEQ